jgi:feruloyl esterase
LLTLNQAAVNACDAADGVVDGVIGDPRKCNFDPQVLLCPANPADPNKCLTQAEIDTVKAIYGGLKDPTTGKQFWPGYEKGSEDQWAGHINPFSIPPSYFKYMVYKDPSWDYHTYDLTSAKNFADIYKADRELGPILDATNANLTPFWAQGGKLLMYHGWSDQNIAPRNSISYYESVMDKMGGRDHWKTSESLRLFMVPGMQHCQGGSGTDTFDSLGALEQWVEHHKAPDKIIASHLTGGVVDRTRPLCPYPQVAKYKGTGSTNDAANFVCANPK